MTREAIKPKADRLPVVSVTTYHGPALVWGSPRLRSTSTWFGMAWDPALLRKYNTTGHFRLLNQVRTELREQPIQRPLVTSRAAAAGGSRRSGRSGSSGAGASGSAGSGGGTGRTAAAAVGSQASSAATASAPQASTHTTTRRRSAPAPVSAAPRQDHQEIVMVPVLTDLVLPDAHA